MSADNANDEIVRLATASNVAEAYAWRQALQDEGISCKVVGEYLGAVGVAPTGSMSPEIWVHRSEADRAQTILKTWLEKR
jgi:Putative prokaryotic signal transducing protein